MKRLLIIFALAAQIICGQTIYKVIPGSKGNTIILEIENESKEVELTEIKVRLANSSQSLNFKKVEQAIIRIDQSAEVEFEFDVNRAVNTNKVDTLKFVVTGRNGIMESKEILIGYSIPMEFRLEQNYPNPFNPETTIDYQLPEEGRVTLKVFNILGQEIRTLVDENRKAGYYTEKFSGMDFSSGVYIYLLTSGKNRSIKKMMLVK